MFWALILLYYTMTNTTTHRWLQWWWWWWWLSYFFYLISSSTSMFLSLMVFLITKREKERERQCTRWQATRFSYFFSVRSGRLWLSFSVCVCVFFGRHFFFLFNYNISSSPVKSIVIFFFACLFVRFYMTGMCNFWISKKTHIHTPRENDRGYILDSSMRGIHTHTHTLSHLMSRL